MASTVTGVFRIIDRASPAMKGMERQAYRTDAAIASVGKSLDGLSSQARLRRLSQTQRSIRAIGNESKGADRDIDRSSRSLGRMSDQASKATTAFRGLAQALRDFAVLAKPAIFLAIGTAVGIAAQAIGALAGGVVGLLPKLVDLGGAVAPAGAGIVGLGLAAVTAKLAFKDFGEALGGNADALKRLTPEARKFLNELKGYKPIMDNLRQSAQKGLFPGLSDAMKTLTSGPGPAALNRMLGMMGRRMGGVARQAAGRISGAGFTADFERLGNQGGRMITQLSTALLDLVDVFRHFFVAAEPFTDWMTKAIANWVKGRAEIARFNRDSGKTAGFLNRTKDSLELMVRVGGNLWTTLKNILQAARPLGDILWAGIDKATKRWADYTGTVEGQVSLTRQFTAMAPAIKEMAGLVGDLGKALFRMGSDPNLAGTIANLRQLVPPLERILTQLANTLGPPLTRALTQITEAVANMGGLTGPIVVFLQAATGILKVFNRLAETIPGFGKAVGAALSVALIGRFLVKLGLLEAGWWRVARSAGAAAVATNAASGGGGILGGLGGKLGKGRLARAGRVGGIGLIASMAAGPAVEAASGSSYAGSLASSTATGAALGATVGSFIAPGIGTAIGGVAGGLGGLGYGLYQNRNRGAGDQVSAIHQNTMAGVEAAGIMGGGQLKVAQYELKVFHRALKDLSAVTGAAAEAERQAVTLEIEARRQVIGGLREEAAGRKRASSAAWKSEAAAGLDRGYALLRKQGASKEEAIQQVRARAQQDMKKMTPSDQQKFARGLFAWAKKEAPGSPQIAAMQRELGSLLGPGQRGGRQQAFTGSRDELAGINKKLGTFDEQVRQAQAAMTPMQKLARLSLIARGFSEAEANKIVGAADAQGTGVGQPKKLTPVMGPPAPGPGLTGARGGVAGAGGGGGGGGGWAGGGRIPGKGVHDTVPVGGMAAPGELIVNRHTENKVNQMLGGKTSLGSLVGGENRRHSDSPKRGSIVPGYRYGGRFATGGRQAVLSEAARISALNSTYQYGGGHSNPVPSEPPWDCSSSVSRLLQVGGLGTPTMVSGDMMNIGEPGPGWFTIYANDGHVYSTIGGRAWGTSYARPNHGPGYFEGGAREGFTVRHIPQWEGGGSGGGGGTSTNGTSVARGATPTPGSQTGGLLGVEQTRRSALTAITGFGGMGLSGGTATSPASGGARPAGGPRPAGAGAATAAPSSGGGGNLISWLQGAGFKGEALKTAWGIAQRESSGRPSAFNGNAGTGDLSYGLFQINMLGSMGPARRRQFGISKNEELFSPTVNARAAYQMSSGGSNFGPWGIGPNAYRQMPPLDLSGFPLAPGTYAKGGRTPSFAGWFAKGGTFDTSGPTVFGAGERGKERVSITPAGGGTMPTKIEVHVHGGGGQDVYEMARAGAAAALDEFADKLERTSA